MCVDVPSKLVVQKAAGVLVLEYDHNDHAGLICWHTHRHTHLHARTLTHR